MLFWIISGLLAAGIAGAIILTMRAGRAGAGESDRAIYAAQMGEIERDAARGVITEAEAEELRTEIGRRLLRADAEEGASGAPVPGGATLLGGLVVALGLVGGSFALYLWLGVPGYPDLRMPDRLALAEEIRAARPSQEEAEARAPSLPLPGNPETEALISDLRGVLAERQNDLEGFRFLVRGEATLGNYTAARVAMERVIVLEGANARAADFATLADLMVLAADGYVSPEAEAAALEALQREPGNGSALYYIGLSAIQTGRPDMGFRIWRDLLERSAADDPWVPPIRAQIGELAAMAGVNYTLPEMTSLRGPTREDIEAAGELSAEERSEQIRGMVAGLADRLANEGGPVEEWVRLIRSLRVLGETDDATAIAAEARLVFAQDAEALSLIEAAAP